ncbi:hypothetical protein OCH239_22180 [Roseivivax halodurans JCM 10272]|uniref:Lipoprotein n=1 Tax=Roseivivax halodurans JCM 10272 TaxID=1449350 RepID=X7EHM9_9RHOB|nr:hypothetical protein [Roseivivax halodurans]ETX14711.1 hypothetical protein OCH239_22180 [Roseivivax halodurans JCM 10272]
MKLSLGVLLISAGLAAGCGAVRDSRVNPFNWFGGATSRPVAAGTTGAANPLLPERSRAGLFRRETEEVYAAPPIAVIDELLIERRPGGAVIRTTGIAERAGPFDVRLVAEEQAEPTALVMTLRALQRPGPRNTGPDARKVTAARWLTDSELAGIGRIEVRGAQNVLTTRR